MRKRIYETPSSVEFDQILLENVLSENLSTPDLEGGILIEEEW